MTSIHMDSLGNLIQSPTMRFCAAIAWTILLCILLVQPDDRRLIETGIPRGPNTLPRELFFAAAHLLAFAMTCFLWFRAWSRRMAWRRSLALACGMALFIGGVTEALQAFSPERYPSFGDVAANCVGALAMAWIIRRQQRRKERV